jgi:4'-phosphopantetheinyl transferase
VVSRILLRRVLGACLARPADRLEFITDANGKPHLADAAGLHFNLAHTGDLMVLAVTAGSPVGVDVERVRELKDACGIARRFFTARESGWLQGRRGKGLSLAFFRLWTRKEAILKATGEGLSRGLEVLELLDKRGRLLPSVSRGSPGAVWRLHALEPAAGFVAALAVPADRGDVRLKMATCRPG